MFSQKKLKIATTLASVFITLIVIVLILFVPEGLFSPEIQNYLMAPRSSSKDLKLESCIQKTLATQSFCLVYPNCGINKSPITYFDLNNDGQNEAIIFCNDSNLHPNVIYTLIFDYDGNSWSEINKTKISAKEVDQFFIADINKDNNFEILVGYISENNIENILYFYQYVDNNRINSNKLDLHYKNFYVDNFDSNPKSEIFLSQSINNAISDGGPDYGHLEARLLRFDDTKNIFSDVAILSHIPNMRGYTPKMSFTLSSGKIGDGPPCMLFFLDDTDNLNKFPSKLFYGLVYYDESNNVLVSPSVHQTYDDTKTHTLIEAALCNDVNGDGIIDFSGRSEKYSFQSPANTYYFNYDFNSSRWVPFMGVILERGLDFSINIPLDLASRLRESGDFVQQYDDFQNCLSIRSSKDNKDIVLLKTFDKNMWEITGKKEGFLEITSNDLRVYAVKYVNNDLDELLNLDTLKDGIVTYPCPLFPR